ncbi:MOSC N-terminal beta barrel domain-containing protein [Pseudokineococcus lusitanus]|uniref:Molybdenum cofactor sulfurase middle domain-containing protein n=1 Tax=Pseudokineococcus lusitanus TaxID=763993 RepID=A0A3N1G8P6_9ACTN|nr:MOSC N-terminal beta barrel domain-containing protein [Pseudokineococcus lusitanus]ROP26602.1 hypothetical protein EDC03_3359 [Pseudokineococcus lusitanus]
MDQQPHPAEHVSGAGGRHVGRVASLTRYPLRSAGGEALDAVAVTPDGLEGDRVAVLAGPDGRPLRSRDAPGLARLRATLVDGRPRVVDADGTPLDGADVGAAAGVAGARAVPSADLAAGPGSDGVAPLHVVSEGAEAGPDAEGCDPFPRANVVLALDPAEGPGAERGWTGAGLRVGGEGGALLRVVRTPKRCLGVYAEVVVPGRAAVGDDVVLLPAGDTPAAG